MILSLDTLAMMDAAATERLRESPLMSVRCGMERERGVMPSIRRKSGTGISSR